MPDDSAVTHDGDPDTTISTETRWKYIGTILSSLMILSLAVITIGVAAGFLSLSGIGQAWLLLYSTVTLMAAVWAFGEETLKTVHKFKGNG